MSEYYSILTKKGEQALFESIANQTAFNPLYMAVGDSSGSYYEPEETQTALKNEKYRAQIHFKGINKKDNFIYFTLQIPPSEGDYTIREVGLFSKDNELLGIAKYPETLKQKADTQSDKTLSVEFQIFLSNKTINTIIIDNNANPLLNLDAQPYDENRNYSKTEWATDVIDNKKTIFESLIDENQGNPLTDETKWKKVSLGGGSKELLEIYIDPFIDESKNTGRILNGQVIIQEQFQSAVNKLKKCVGWDGETQNASLMPEIICSEDEWQTLKTMSVIGQAAKFVIDDEAGTLRLPAIKNIQGVYALNQSGIGVKQTLPNINAKVTLVDDSVKGADSYSAPFYIDENEPTNFDSSGGVGQGGVLRMDLSKYSDIYQDNAPVQQEACCFPYCICLNPEVEESEKPINEYEIINPNTLLESKYSPMVLDNLSYLRSNEQRNSGDIYLGVWDKLIKAYNAKAKIGLADVKLITDETATDYDFRIDLETNEFILPLLDGSEKFPSYDFIYLNANTTEYTAPYNGFLHAHLNNGSIQLFIKGGMIGTTSYSAVVTGSNNTLFVKKGQTVEILSSGVLDEIHFTKAKGNGYLYFYVGDTAQNPQMVNVARMEEKLVDKTDKHQASHASMPSGEYIDNIFNPTITTTLQIFTAPCDGVIYIQNTSNTIVYLGTQIYDNLRSYCAVTLGNAAGASINGWVKVAKGDAAYIQTGSGTATLTVSRFTKNKGEV